jgi:hypothetical protein
MKSNQASRRPKSFAKNANESKVTEIVGRPICRYLQVCRRESSAGFRRPANSLFVPKPSKGNGVILKAELRLPQTKTGAGFTKLM